MADEEIPFTQEVTMPSSADSRMARAMVVWALRRRRTYVIVGGLSVAMAFLFYFRGYDGDGLDAGTRLFASAFWAAGFAIVLVLALSALIYFSNRRTFRQAARPGSVMRTGFGAEEFVTSNDLASSRFSYSAWIHRPGS